MYKTASGSRRLRNGAAVLSALMMILALTLLTVSLLTGCEQSTKPDETTAPSTAAPTAGLDL